MIFGGPSDDCLGALRYVRLVGCHEGVTEAEMKIKSEAVTCGDTWDTPSDLR